MHYSFGTDPELWLINDKNEFVSAHDIIPGSKQNPTPVSQGAIQPDGTAAEFNIDPATDALTFSNNIREVLLQLSQIVGEHGLRLHVAPTATFKTKYFKTLPATALAFGCTPDYNVWTGMMTEFKGTKKPFRTAAGHLHIGWLPSPVRNVMEHSHMFDCTETVKQLDASLYLSSLLWDTDTLRRTLYGKMGSFRPKPYGVEYRPLSNAWIADPDLHIFVFNTAKHAVTLLDENERLFEDYAVRLNLDAARDGEILERSELLDFHDFLVREYDFPKLPDGYLEEGVD